MRPEDKRNNNNPQGFTWSWIKFNVLMKSCPTVRKTPETWNAFSRRVKNPRCLPRWQRAFDAGKEPIQLFWVLGDWSRFSCSLSKPWHHRSRPGRAAGAPGDAPRGPGLGWAAGPEVLSAGIPIGMRSPAAGMLSRWVRRWWHSQLCLQEPQLEVSPNTSQRSVSHCCDISGWIQPREIREWSFH